MSLEIRELAPDLTDDYLAFFDNEEYKVLDLGQGEGWVEEPTLELPTPEQEAKSMKALLLQSLTGGDGLTIAYHGLNLGRVSLCATAAGTMRVMLANILPCAKFRREGLAVAEAYPTTAPPSGPYADQIPWSAHNHTGPLEMYRKAGFTLHRQLERFAVVRKSL